MKINVQIVTKENMEYYNCESGAIQEIEFEDYVATVTAAEIGTENLDAAKAQAIAVRSFAVQRGVLKGKVISDSTATAQAFRTSRMGKYPVCIQGARETAGIVLTYNDKVISAVYSASNGGRTVSAEEQWGSAKPYLIAQNDPWDTAVGKKKNGHGVGMSQNGMKYAAKSGISYDKILAFYYPGTKLKANYGESEGDTMAETKAEKVVRLAKERIGYPYVYAALGEECNPRNRKARANKATAHPTIISSCQVLSGKAATCDGCKWKGTQMFDCRGFTWWILNEVGVKISNVGATTQYNTKADWSEQGKIADMPNKVCCVFIYKNGKMDHTGIHIGDGHVIHASVGVREDKIGDKNWEWSHYAIPKGLYDEGGTEDMASLKNGSSGQQVKDLQTMLNALGFDCGKVDGKFGKNTDAAVRKFQNQYGLTVDGIVGAKTYEKIKLLYTSSESDQAPVDDIELKECQALLTELKKQILALQAQANALQERINNIK